MVCTQEPTCKSGSDLFVQLRSKELGEHEAKLQAWRVQTQEETQRHIQEREATLSDWSARLDARSRELDSQQKALQVLRHPPMIWQNKRALGQQDDAFKRFLRQKWCQKSTKCM